MSVFEQGADAKMCQVTITTAFEKANLHVQIAASLQYIISLLLLLLYVFLSFSLCIPREWDANLHVSIATMGRCSFLDARPVSGFPSSIKNNMFIFLVLGQIPVVIKKQ